MVKLSLIEKLKTLLNVIKNTNESLLIIPIVIIVGILIYATCSNRRKINSYLYTLIYLSIIGTLLYNFGGEILTLLDYMMESIVANILFPNLAIYIGVLIVVNIIIIGSILGTKLKAYIKNINVICFSVMQLLLFFIVKNIINNDINIYEKLNIYTNQELLVLVEVSMLVFVSWLFILLVIGIINTLIKKAKTNELHIVKDYSKVNLNDSKFINNDVLTTNNYRDGDALVSNYELLFNKMQNEDEKRA